MNTKELFIICNRYVKHRRLNHEVFGTLEEAKHRLNKWEEEEDPEREQRKKSEEARRVTSPCTEIPNRGSHHNSREFEVMTLEEYIHHVALDNYEKAHRDTIYTGAFKTMVTCENGKLKF